MDLAVRGTVEGDQGGGEEDDAGDRVGGGEGEGVVDELGEEGNGVGEGWGVDVEGGDWRWVVGGVGGEGGCPGRGVGEVEVDGWVGMEGWGSGVADAEDVGVCGVGGVEVGGDGEGRLRGAGHKEDGHL